MANRGGKIEWNFLDIDTLREIGSIYLNGTHNMKVQREYFYSEGETLYVYYYSSGKQPFSYRVSPGYNMISLPLVVEDNSVDAVCPDTIGIENRAYRYSTESGRWVTVDNIEPGEGYAVLFSQDKDVIVWGYPIYNMSIDIALGWNLIGSVMGSVSEDEIITEPSDLLLPGLWWYNPVRSSYENNGRIEAGKGYFVAANDVGTVELHSDGSIFGKGSEEIPAVWRAELEIETEGKRSQFIIGEAKSPIRMEQLPVMPGAEDNPVKLVREGEYLFADIGSRVDKWEFVSKTSAPLHITATGDYSQLVVEYPGGQKELSEKEVTLPSVSSFTVYKLSKARPPFTISSPWPNPFNLETHIVLSLPRNSDVNIEIVNITGKKVWGEEVKGLKGDNVIKWDGRSDDGRVLPSGVYFIKVKACEITKNMPVLLIK